MKEKRKKRLAILRANRIHKGKSWWKHLEKIDKVVFMEGFVKNKMAEEIQKKETEFNRQKINRAKII